MSKKIRKGKVRRQFGAVPYRLGPKGQFQVLLVTTRETGRWMAPKGWPIKKLGPLGTAMQEAYEEAGVRGESGPAIGSFDYLKIMRDGRAETCVVEMFLLRVDLELEEWPEKEERTRRWFDIEEATAAVCELSLKNFLAKLPNQIMLKTA